MSSQDAGIPALQDKELLLRLRCLQGAVGADPNASIIIPANTKEQLSQACTLLADLSRYRGSYTLEFILACDFPGSGLSPDEIEFFHSLGVRLIFPETEQPERVEGWIHARFLGVRDSRAGITLHFAPDARIPDATSLVDWYIHSLYSGYQLAYTRIEFEGLPARVNTRLSLAVLNGLRGLKRRLLGVPTTRGCNYAITRSLFLELYETGMLSPDINIGLAARLAEARSRYSNEPRLRVVLSARKYSPRSLLHPARILRRLSINLRAVPVAFKTSEWINWIIFSDEAEKREEYASPFAGER